MSRSLVKSVVFHLSSFVYVPFFSMLFPASSHRHMHIKTCLVPKKNNGSKRKWKSTWKNAFGIRIIIMRTIECDDGDVGDSTDFYFTKKKYNKYNDFGKKHSCVVNNSYEFLRQMDSFRKTFRLLLISMAGHCQWHWHWFFFSSVGLRTRSCMWNIGIKQQKVCDGNTFPIYSKTHACNVTGTCKCGSNSISIYFENQQCMSRRRYIYSLCDLSRQKKCKCVKLQNVLWFLINSNVSPQMNVEWLKNVISDFKSSCQRRSLQRVMGDYVILAGVRSDHS